MLGCSAPRIMAIVAWIIAILAFFGVRYLFPGLHAYA